MGPFCFARAPAPEPLNPPLSQPILPQLPPPRRIIGHQRRHKRPEARGMVELAEMGELVHDEVFLQGFGEEEHPEVEAERPLAGTAPLNNSPVFRQRSAS